MTILKLSSVFLVPDDVSYTTAYSFSGYISPDVKSYQVWGEHYFSKKTVEEMFLYIVLISQKSTMDRAELEGLKLGIYSNNEIFRFSTVVAFSSPLPGFRYILKRETEELTRQACKHSSNKLCCSHKLGFHPPTLVCLGISFNNQSRKKFWAVDCLALRRYLSTSQGFWFSFFTLLSYYHLWKLNLGIFCWWNLIVLF